MNEKNRMTDRERKDYYLKRLRYVLVKKKILRAFPGLYSEHIEEELRIIMWNNPEEWANSFMTEEVIPLLEKHGITVKGAT